MSINPAAPIIECDSLTKVFQDFWGRGKVLAVDDLSLRILPGEVFGLLGPNGSGKTTTIKMLLGLLYPTRGRARVFDRLPTDTAAKARIGYMPEESYLYRFLDAYETLDYYGRIFRLDTVERRRRTEQLIEMVGLQRAARRPIGQYSKGMARRIGLAQALINDPDLLILDEPTTGLDPIGSRQIKDVIVELAKRGKTVVLCSHLLADVEDVCDRAAIMYGGRLQALGTMRELLSRRDVTQITLKQPAEPVLSGIRRYIEQSTGQPVMSVDHPTDRLEDLFLRVVAQAQRDQLATSGAESGRGVSDFLAAPQGAQRRRPEELLQSLVAAGVASEPAEPIEPGATEAAPRVAPKFEVLEELSAAGAPPTESEPEPVDGPRALPSKPAEPNRSVIERLTRPDDQS
ncbi:MAG: ATP-binding cassette domain-containing protein [Phycisphaerae bacterium]